MPGPKVRVDEVVEKIGDAVGRPTVQMVIDLPTKKDPGAGVSIGVTAGRRSRGAGGPGKRRMSAHEAAERSGLFIKGGSAFTRWLMDEGIDPILKRVEAEWQELLSKFAKRPIHGHRRGKKGGSHRRR